jgi:TRAP-type C4-dicarboxylate transport system permease small subunit
MKRLLVLSDRFNLVCGYLAGFAILLIAVMQIVEIASRNVLNYSLPFVWEYGAYMHAGAVFMAAAYTLRTGGHVRVAMLLNRAPKVFEIVATSLALLISILLTYSMIRFAIGFGVAGRTSSTINQVPLVWPTSFMALGATLLTLQLSLRLVLVATGEAADISWGGEEGLAE